MNNQMFFTGFILLVLQMIVAVIVLSDWSWVSVEIIFYLLGIATFIIFNIICFYMMLRGALQE